MTVVLALDGELDGEPAGDDSDVVPTVLDGEDSSVLLAPVCVELDPTVDSVVVVVDTTVTDEDPWPLVMLTPV